MGYRVTKDLRAEVRVGGSLFLKDLFLLILFPTVMWFITGTLVTSGLEIWYMIPRPHLGQEGRHDLT